MEDRRLPDAADALIVDEHRAWSAAEVWEVANPIAAFARGLTDGGRRRVGICSENSAMAVIAHLAAMRSGASVVPINSHLTALEIANQLEVGDVAVLFSGDQTATATKAACELARHDHRPCAWEPLSRWDGRTALPSSVPPVDDRPIRPNLLFTSGTTGTPKATELPPNVFPRRDTWAEFVQALAANRFVGRGRHLVVAPLHHTGPLNAVRALAAGTPIGILERFDPAGVLAAIEDWQIGSTTLVPTHLSRFAALPDSVRAAADTSSLRLVFQTGSSCPIDVKRAMIEWWGPVFLEAYGATEVGVTASITSPDWLDHPGSVGRSVPPYEVMIVDDDGRLLGPDIEGLLCFRDTTGRGIVYLDDPERTAAAHVTPGVFTLGEVGRVDAEGWIYVTDRVADMVVTGGVNVYPAEMEQVLVTHPDVADVAGIGVPDPDLGELLIALVVAADPDTPPAMADLQAWCEARLSRFKCPRRIRLVDSLDRNALGKIDKRALRARHNPLDPSAATPAPIR